MASAVCRIWTVSVPRSSDECFEKVDIAFVPPWDALMTRSNPVSIDFAMTSPILEKSRSAPDTSDSMALRSFFIDEVMAFVELVNFASSRPIASMSSLSSRLTRIVEFTPPGPVGVATGGMIRHLALVRRFW